ncbi:MAG TPA: hypothetical protein VNX88_02085 [Terriglobales bacterium]|jgi:hypothetical protein|nr:hypothetical protein [Terriglobales bacterium]
MRLKMFFLVVIAVIASASFSFAGPPFPCPTAVNSVHGNALAIVHDTIDWKGDTGKLLSIQFTVMSKAAFLNDYQRISAPVTYWGDWAWAVVLDMNKEADRSFSFCGVPLITDDAHFLILLATGPAFRSALRIYRQGDSSDRMEDGTIKGVLVKEIKLNELWPAAKIDPILVWTDHTPEWFAFGTFDFTPDNLQLIHKTRWGNAVRINLSDGKVLKE